MNGYSSNINVITTITSIIRWIENYADKANKDRLVVGVSGGIDSAVVSSLCARTNKKCLFVTMPIHQASPQTNRGIEHIEDLKSSYSNIDSYHVDLTETYEKLKTDVSNTFQDDLGLANTRARLRMTTLYMCASSLNGLVIGTGNKVEDFGVGFYTKYGDGGVDISPIADLYKTEVYRIADALNVRKDIINAQPTDGLWDDGRTDEDQLGCTYQDLEWAMEYEDLQLDDEMTEEEEHAMKTLNKHRNANMHKMQDIPVFQVRRVR